MGTTVLLDRGEAAARLHVSERTVRRYGKTGLLEERKVGPKLVKVTAASVSALIRAGKAASTDRDAASAAGTGRGQTVR